MSSLRLRRKKARIVLYCLVRNLPAWSSRERARAAALVARSFRFGLLGLFFIVAS